MKNTNLTKLLTSDHERKWVALSPDYKSIVDYAENLADLVVRIAGKKVVYMKVLPRDTEFAF